MRYYEQKTSCTLQLLERISAASQFSLVFNTKSDFLPLPHPPIHIPFHFSSGMCGLWPADNFFLKNKFENI